MAQSVLKLLADADLRGRMGAFGRACVMEFDISHWVATLESAYRECSRIRQTRPFGRFVHPKALGVALRGRCYTSGP
jgi:hypothetical protein